MSWKIAFEILIYHFHSRAAPETAICLAKAEINYHLVFVRELFSFQEGNVLSFPSYMSYGTPLGKPLWNIIRYRQSYPPVFSFGQKQNQCTKCTNPF